MADTESLHLRFDAFELDEADARLTRDGRPVPLPPKAFAVLCALARTPGQLVRKNALLDAVWGHQHVSESVLKTTISEVRAALSDDAKQPRYIETASRRGYRFIGNAGTMLGQSAQEAASTILPSVAPVKPLPVPPLIGRQGALTLLNKAWDNAAAGKRQIFWVAGEAGVGKTTLIDNFVASRGPLRYAHGQCVEQTGAGEPYLPVLEALGSLCRNDPALVPLLRAAAPTWLVQLPWLCSDSERQALRQELASANQDRMLREMGELLDRYTQESPLLLVTEDLHWSDHATVRLIDHCARRRGAARLMWLGTFRLAEVISEDHPLKGLRHELRLHRLCDEIFLDSFSEREVADYLENRFPRATVPESFVRTIHDRTDGLPLFVVNVIDELISQGTLKADETHRLAASQITTLQVPENLAGVIEKQIARLPAELRMVLEAASVCGVEFRPGVVADALERDIVWVNECCDELVRRRHWLHPTDVNRLPDGSLDARYMFRHALYRQVLYQCIGALTRAQLHRRVAHSLDRGRSSGFAVAAAELASHYELSHDAGAALRHFAEAAENALRRFAPVEAMALVAHASGLLAQCPEGPARDALEVTLSAMRGVAAAQLIGVGSPDAKQAFEHAQALLEIVPKHPMRSLVLHALGLVLLVRGEYSEAHALGERVHALSKAHGDRILLLSACSVLGQVHTLQGRQQPAREWLEMGIAACDEIGDATLQAAFVVDPGVTMYAALAISLLHLGFVDQARRRLELAYARARRLGQPMAHMVATWFNALLEVRMHNPERVGALADALKMIVDGAALAQGEGPSRWFRGWADARLGAPRDGHQVIRDAYKHNARLGLFSGASEVLGYAAEALALTEDWTAAQAQLDEALQVASKLGERVYLPQMLMLKGQIALGRGEIAVARASILSAVAEAREQQALWPELITLVALCQLPGAVAEDFAALEHARGRLHEGLDSALVKTTDELLHAAGRTVPDFPLARP